MLGTFLGEECSLVPQSHCASHLQTTFTTTGAVGAEESFRPAPEPNEGSLCARLQRLEEKSSRIISKLPSIHSRLLRAQTYARDRPFPTAPAAPDLANKLRIIQDLGIKIERLESGINDPALDGQAVRQFQQQIDLDFESYYQESRTQEHSKQQQPQRDSGDNGDSEEDSLDSRSEDSEPQAKNRERQTQTSILSHQQIPLFVALPKLIEIEIPYELYRPKPVDSNPHSEPRNSSEGQGSLPARSRSNEDSSIGRIIDHFNHGCYPGHPDQPYTYRISHAEEPEGREKEEFHLPLNSYEHCCSERAKSQAGESQRLKKTDRSELSSDGERDHRDDIWNKEELGFNHEHLSLVKEHDRASSDHSHAPYPDHQIHSDEREKLLIALNAKISQLTEENLSLAGRLEEEREEREEMASQLRTAEVRAAEREAECQQEAERTEELREEGRQLNTLLLTYKDALLKHETHVQQLQDRIRCLERDFAARLDEREAETHELLRTLHERTEELDESNRLNEELKAMLGRREKEHEAQLQEAEGSVNQLRDEVAFYKGKLEEEGINLKLEEAHLLQDLLEKREEEERLKMTALEKALEGRYRGKLHELTTENQRLIAQLETLKSQPPTSLETNDGLEQQIQQLLAGYTCQLSQKEQIPPLRGEEERALAIRGILGKLAIGQGSQDALQAVYLIDRLLRALKLYEYAAAREKEERTRMAQKLTALNLFFNRQLEKAEERNLALEEERQRLRRQAQEAARELKRAGQRVEFYRGKVEGGEGELREVLQLENEFLELERAKLQGKYERAVRYSEQLEGRFLSDLMHSGSSFCELFCTHREAESSRQQEYERRITSILREMKEHGRSVLCPEASTLSPSRLSNCRLASAVFSLSARPATRPPAGKLASTPAIKALLTPLPDIPKSVSATPLPSITLDKLLEKRICTSGRYRERVCLRLVELGAELVRVSRKLFALRPCQMLVNSAGEEVSIVLRREFGSASEEEESALIYRAPEVLLGFSESEASYVWTIGLILDQIFHERLFYRKLTDVLSRNDNYHVRNPDLTLAPLLARMMRKNHKERPSLAAAREQLLHLSQPQ